jgi:hypothetical protein
VRSLPLCNQDANQDCGACDLRGQVHCGHGSRTAMRTFWTRVAAYAAPGFSLTVLAALATGSAAWPLGLLAFWVVYQGGVELLLHCAHCPHTNDDLGHYDCPVNVGLPRPRWLQRWARFRPRPFTRAEKGLQRAFNTASGLLPALAGLQAGLARGGWWWAPVAGLVAWQAAASVTFLRYLRTTHCHHCLHFSCVWNRQPAEVVRRWLAKNPGLAAGWAGAAETLDVRRPGPR